LSQPEELDDEDDRHYHYDHVVVVVVVVGSAAFGISVWDGDGITTMLHRRPGQQHLPPPRSFQTGLESRFVH
jgi:hypothetical protein